MRRRPYERVEPQSPADASTTFSVVRLTFDIHHAANPSTADRSLTPAGPGSAKALDAQVPTTEAFIPEPGVERLNEGVLLRLFRRDVVPLDAASVRPVEHGPRGELGPIAHQEAFA